MSKRGKLVTSEAMNPDLAGAWLQIDSGENEELVRVLKVRGREVTVGRWRWYHSLLRSARRFPRLVWLRLLLPVAWKAQEVLCGVRGHRLTVGSRDVFGENLTSYCWCGKRYEYIGEAGEPE